MAQGLFLSMSGFGEKKTQLLKEFGFVRKDGSVDEEEREVIQNDFAKTGYPTPKQYHRVTMEVFDLSLEGPYYWILEDLGQKFIYVDKIEDSFAAAENSAFFGITQTRLGGQQDKVSQFLATTGKMIKELFQMVRELRILDERLKYYGESKAEVSKSLSDRGKSAEITLKGLFVDLVQGGGKSAASVYGMARELEFITLPDLFFDAPPFKNAHEMETYVESLGKDFNRNVLRVMQRHLRQFMEWKTRTHQEHVNRKRFMRQYLWQHYEIIKMYINWVKPYLRHVSKLTMKEQNLGSPELISAFEGSMLDIELLARRRFPVGKDGANGVVIATMNYRTRPEMKVVQEGYQRGPVHIGRFELNLRVYAWTDKQVAAYKAMKEKENLLLMGEISASVQSAMEALGAELEKYLEEARGEMDQKDVVSEKKDERGIAEKLFGDFYNPKSKKPSGKKPSKGEMKAQKYEMEKKLKALLGYTNGMCWLVFKNFKKAHRMIMW
jgi:hypothetical protein